jgi:hypothetical protein
MNFGIGLAALSGCGKQKSQHTMKKPQLIMVLQTPGMAIL